MLSEGSGLIASSPSFQLLDLASFQWCADPVCFFNDLPYNREIQTTFALTCGKVGMWEWNSRKATRGEHCFFMCYSDCGFFK